MTQKHISIQERTTIIPSAAENYLLHDMPCYRECGLTRGASAYALHRLCRADYFEFELRQYIGGRTRTLHSLNREVSSFLSLDEFSARTLITISLDVVQYHILTNEWYELMPRYLSARRRIQKKFRIENPPVTPTGNGLAFKSKSD